MATIWIGVIGTPADTVAKVGLEIVGTVLGLMVMARLNAPPVPAALVAVRAVVVLPLVATVPLMTPVEAFSVSPAGRALPTATA